MCCFARTAAMSGRPRCARYGLGRRSLAGGSHTRPTLAMAWAVFAANAGGASVASALVAQETRLAAPRSCPRRAMLLVPVGKGPAACARSRRGRRVPAPTARAMGAGLPAPAARKRFECPKARREACALWALGPKAQSDPKRGSETMSATVREARMIEQPGHKKRASPHRPACYPGANRPHHPSEVWRAAALQAEIRIQRHARWIRQPCASKATLRRPPPGEPAAKPPAK